VILIGFMEGECYFCKENKELTIHHIIAQNYKGKDDSENLIPNVCIKCHPLLERSMDKARGLIGAGKDFDVCPNVMVGKTNVTLKIGSSLLSNTGLALVDLGSPIYGARVHNKIIGQTDMELFISGGVQLAIVGSPKNSWVVYAIAKP